MALLRKPTETKARGRRSYNRTPLTTYYRSKNQPDQTSPFHKKPPTKNRRKFFFGIVDIGLVSLLILGLVNSLLLDSPPKVIATDLSYHPASVYKAQVKNDFQGFNNHNKLTFDEPAVIKKIQSQFPEVAAVHVELPFFSRQPKVRLIVSPPAFKLTSDNRAFVVDSQGLAVSKAENLPKIGNLTTITDQSGFDTQAGKQVLSSQSVDFIEALIKQCQTAKVPITSLSLPALPQELDLKTTDQPYYVKFYMGGDANTEIGQFLASRHQFASSNITPAEYLDVRVSGKIFYK